MNEKLIQSIVSDIVHQYTSSANSGTVKKIEIPAESSGRHVHLCQEDIEFLFGKGYKLKPKKDISQPGQYLCEERVTLIGEKNEYKNVAVLGPPRDKTQVEVSFTDAMFLGIKNAPVAMSGDLSKAADIIIQGNGKCLNAQSSVIVAKNHIHMSEEEAKRFNLKNGDIVDVEMATDRPVTLKNVAVRSGKGHRLAMHIDYDEANACHFTKNDKAFIIAKSGCDSTCSDNRCCENSKGDTSVSAGKTVLDVHYLSEEKMREFFLKGISEVAIKKGTVVSPLAKDFANQKKIKIIFYENL